MGPEVGNLRHGYQKSNSRTLFLQQKKNILLYKQKFKRNTLTKGTDKLSLNRPGDGLDQGGRCEPSKKHVVQEDDVEVSEPVVPTKVSQ